MATVNKEGIYHIQDWIDTHQEYNPRVFDLWANGIASEVNRCANLDDDLQRNGEFIYEVGLRDAQGHVMTIALEKQHFEMEG
jgi:hypothetical protein